MTGATMWPRYRPGERLLADFNGTPAEGADVFIEMHDGGCHVARLTAVTDTTIIASHLNPSREFTLDQRDVRRLCPVVDPMGAAWN